jgi:hypothetical protein
MYKILINKVREKIINARSMTEALKKIEEPHNEVLSIEMIDNTTKFLCKSKDEVTEKIENLNKLHDIEDSGWTIISMEKIDDEEKIAGDSIDSSWISGINYDFNDRILTVDTTSGNVYDYKNVPYDVYEDFLAAESAGRFFNQKIKGVLERVD